jgi:transposase-like protein
MEFVPPFCPNTECDRHSAPKPRFFLRHGFYQPACRSEQVPRFRCRSCRRTFSSQTFRQDYRDRRPDLNRRLFEHLVSGTGYRQSARLLAMGVHAVQWKARKLARHAGHLHDNLCRKLPAGRTFVLDEEETYEHASIRTLTMPVLIEKDSWFVVATAVGPTRRLAPAGTRRRAWQDHEERTRGVRQDRSRECVVEVLQRLDQRLDGSAFVLRSDLKSSYGTIARELFGDRVTHERTAGSDPRTVRNPLFPINTTLAMTRDNCGRLRRQSWLVTKKGAYLQSQMHQFVVYRNYVRKRFNRDKEDKSPAVHLQLLPRSLTMSDAIRWRQDWGSNSIHPLSLDGSRRVGDTVAQSA